MSVTTATLALTWIAIGLLAFGYAGLRQQLRSVQARLRLPAAARSGVPDAAAALAPTNGERRYVLTLDPGCLACQEVLPRFRELAAHRAPGAQFTLLAAAGDYPPSPGVDVVIDTSTYHQLAPSWSPGLLVVGTGGALLEVAPGGDLAALERLLARSNPPATAPTPEVPA